MHKTALPSYDEQRPTRDGENVHPSSGGRLLHGRRRLIAFAGLCAVALLLVAVSFLTAARRAGSGSGNIPAVAADAGTLALLSAQPHLLFLQTDGDADRQVALAPLASPETGVQLTPLRCQRVHFAAGRGLCLGKDQLTAHSRFRTH
jgi:hypothetical protein